MWYKNFYIFSVFRGNVHIVHFRCLSLCICRDIVCVCVCVCACTRLCVHTWEHILAVFHPLPTIRCLTVEPGMRGWPLWGSGPSGLPEPARDPKSWPVITKSHHHSYYSTFSVLIHHICCGPTVRWSVTQRGKICKPAIITYSVHV